MLLQVDEIDVYIDFSIEILEDTPGPSRYSHACRGWLPLSMSTPLYSFNIRVDIVYSVITLPCFLNPAAAECK